MSDIREDDSGWVAACRESLLLLDVAETLAPGPDLLAACVEVSARSLCGQGRVRLAALWKQVVTWTAVQEWRCQLSAVQAAGGDGLLVNGVVAELAVTTALSEASVQRAVSDAYGITGGLPVMTAALEAGELTVAHGKALDAVLHGVPADVTAAVDVHVTPRAVERSWTPYQLKQAAVRYLLRIDPDGSAQRAADRKKDESDVRYRTLGDGLAELTATGDDVLLRHVKDAVDATAGELVAHAAGAHAAGAGADPVAVEVRVGECRVEALARLVLGDQTVDRPAVQVLVTMTAETLLGLTNTPATVSGVGPVPAHLARELAADGSWRRLLTDPVTGHLIDLGLTAYRPSAALQRVVRAANQTCRFPGCHQQAVNCDLDHRINHNNGGGTDQANLGPLCRRHHNLKTFRIWHVHRHPDGTETWTSPHGFTRTTEPADYRELSEPTSNDPAPPVHLIPDPAALAALFADTQHFDPWTDPHGEGWTLTA